MTKMFPIVSVIIPTYNHAQFLPLAVQSVFAQTYQDFEIIVVDDGSTDNTCAVAQTFTDTRFRYIYQANQGLAASRNTGIRAAQGQFVAFLDADDIFLPNKLEVQLGWLQANPTFGMVVGGYYHMDEQGLPLKEHRPWLRNLHLEVKDWLFHCPVVVHAALVRRDWVEQVGGFDPMFRRVEDWDFWLRLAYAGCKMGWVKEIVCGYRLLDGQMTRNAAAQKQVSVQMMDKFYSQANLPSYLIALKPEVYGRLYTVCAGREYGAEQCEDGKESVAQAIKYIPDLLKSRQTEFINELLSWADNPFVGDPIRYTQRVLDNLPDEALILKAKKRWALGEVGLRKLFEGYRTRNWPQVRQAGLTVAINAPHRMINRGIISILWQSLINRESHSSWSILYNE